MHSAGQGHVLPLGDPHRAAPRGRVHRAVARRPATSWSGCSTPTRPRSTSPTTASTTRRSTCRPRARRRRVPAGSASHGQPYIAFLGMLEPRKNVPDLVRGWVQACAGRDDAAGARARRRLRLGRRGRRRGRRGAVATCGCCGPATCASPTCPGYLGGAARRRLPEPRRGLRPAGARGDGLRRAGAHHAAAVAARGRRRRRRLHRARRRVHRRGAAPRCSTTRTARARSRAAGLARARREFTWEASAEGTPRDVRAGVAGRRSGGRDDDRGGLLVGGKGTRLRPLTVHTPKPMLPTAGVPFLSPRRLCRRREPPASTTSCSRRPTDSEVFRDGIRRRLGAGAGESTT